MVRKAFAVFLAVFLAQPLISKGGRPLSGQTCYECVNNQSSSDWECRETGFSNWGYLTCQVTTGGCRLGAWCGMGFAHTGSPFLALLPEGIVFGQFRAPCLARNAATRVAQSSAGRIQGS